MCVCVCGGGGLQKNNNLQPRNFEPPVVAAHRRSGLKRLWRWGEEGGGGGCENKTTSKQTNKNRQKPLSPLLSQYIDIQAESGSGVGGGAGGWGGVLQKKKNTEKQNKNKLETSPLLSQYTDIQGENFTQ